MMNKGPVDWKSKIESVIALSSMESEYIGACEMVKIVVWLRQCLHELNQGENEPTLLKIDNMSAKIFAEEHMARSRSRHIDTKFHFIREKITEGLVRMAHESTKEMVADIFTKPLETQSFHKFRKMMGINQLPHLSD